MGAPPVANPFAPPAAAPSFANNVPAFVPEPPRGRGDVFALRNREDEEEEFPSDDDLTSCIVKSKRALNNVFRTHGRLLKMSSPLSFSVGPITMFRVTIFFNFSNFVVCN